MFRELAAARPRFGELRRQMLVQRDGWKVNRIRVHGLYCEEELQVQITMSKKKIATQMRA